MDKRIVDQRELEYILGLPVKVIERYTSDRYLADWKAGRVSMRPLPCIELGPHTVRYHVADAEAWMKELFGKGYQGGADAAENGGMENGERVKTKGGRR